MQAHTILVVEDDFPIADIIAEILSDAGHRVVTAVNGLQAFLRIQAERPDLVISDVMMPVMGGRELCEKLQADPEFSSIPVVLISAVHSARDLEGCNYVAFIKKPFDVEKLLGTVNRTLG